MFCFLFLSSLVSWFYPTLQQATEIERHWLISRAGLVKSTWPADHGDTSRSKFTINAGLNISSRYGSSEETLIKVQKQEELKLAQWIYTTGDNSEFLYIIGGPNPLTLFVAKVDAISLQVLQKISLPAGVYIGGLLMHRNGHVYCVHSNRLFVFWGGDLLNSTTTIIPYKTMNHRLIQTNGMLVTQDGYLVIKQWNLIPDDLALFMSSNNIFRILLLFLTAAGSLTAFFFVSKRFSWAVSAFAAPFLGYIVGQVLFLLICMVVFFLLLGGYDPFTFLSSFHFLDPGAGRGELKIIDPLSLEVVAEAISAERFSYARMAMVALKNSEGEDEDAIVLLGDENVHQYRWRPRSRELFYVPHWTRKYRSYGDGTFPGTGPAIYRNVAYFTDNTFSASTFGATYTLFAAPLDTFDHKGSDSARLVTLADYQAVSTFTPQQTGLVPLWERALYPSKQPPRLTRFQSLVAGDAAIPGFMFWSVAINPVEESLVVWNSAAHSVQCRSLSDLTLKWEIKGIKQLDCLSVAADKGHVYMTDYSGGPTNHGDNWMKTVTHKMFKDLNKFFIVANSSTGQIIANKTISVGFGATVSLVVSGANNDVFMGTREALVRVYV